MSRRERRAAERAARKRGGSSSTRSSRPGPSIGVIAGGAVVVAIIVVLALVGLSGSISDSGSTVQAADVDPPAESLQVGRSLGDPEAPVKIDVYEDTQCPHCKTYTDRIEPLLIAGPVTDGEVFLTYKDMAILGSESVRAAAAMRVAEALDGKFWAFHDVVFHNQSHGDSGGYSSERLADMAELVGLDREDFLSELADPTYAEAVLAETDEGRALEITSTPTLVINGEVSPGVPDWNELRDTIETQLQAAAPA